MQIFGALGLHAVEHSALTNTNQEGLTRPPFPKIMINGLICFSIVIDNSDFQDETCYVYKSSMIPSPCNSCIHNFNILLCILPVQAQV